MKRIIYYKISIYKLKKQVYGVAWHFSDIMYIVMTEISCYCIVILYRL